MRTTALTLSYLFHPIFLPTFGVLLIFSLNTYIAQTTSIDKRTFLIGWIFINTAVIPLLFTAFLRWRKMIDSIQLESREDRLIPFAFAVVLYFTNYFLLKDIPLPNFVYSLVLGSSIAVTAALLFTFFTKVSIHMIGMGGITASIYGIAQANDLPIEGLLIVGILVSGLVGSARYMLKAHTLRQIYLGWVIGFVCVYLPIALHWG